MCRLMRCRRLLLGGKEDLLKEKELNVPAGGGKATAALGAFGAVLTWKPASTSGSTGNSDQIFPPVHIF